MKIAAPVQFFHLVDETRRKHLRQTLFYTAMQDSPILWPNGDLHNAIGQLGLTLFRPPVADGFAGTAQHFQGPTDALRMVGMNSGGRFGVALGQLRVQCRPAFALGVGLNGLADGRIDGRQLCKAFQQGFEIKHGAAHQQGQLTARRDVRHGSQRIAAKIGGRIGVCGIADIH